MKYLVTIEGTYAAELEVEEGSEQRAIALAQQRLGLYPLGTLPICKITSATAKQTSLIIPTHKGKPTDETRH